MFFVHYRRWFFGLSLALVLGALVTLGVFGLNWGPDFVGGAILEVGYEPDQPALDLVRARVNDLALGAVSVQSIGEANYILRSRDLSPVESERLSRALASLAPAGSRAIEKRFSSVGPTFGRELARKGLLAVALVVVLILLYIALVFRRVSRPVSSWVYGGVAVLTMFHDTLIPVGVFALLGHYGGVEVDALSLTALLTILGLSVNDKIVALDRIRENVRTLGVKEFALTVGKSLDETLARSINTSLTILLVLLAIVWFGSDSTRWFALAMAVGMLVATYSSIFIAAPFLVSWHERRVRRATK